MSGRWHIKTEPAIKLISWRLYGFYDVVDVEAFHEETLSILKDFAPAGRHIGLSDLKELVIQSQEAVASFGRVLHDPRVMPLRHAVVTPMSLVRSQFLRVAPNAALKLFDDVDAARAWLLSEA